MYYPEEVIEEVRMRSDIVDVISGYVKLQKKGSNLFGLCPFHHEKSPSFSVSPSKQMYHCFGCGVSGNVITFVMEYENYSFREAVEMLADRSGVKLPKMEYSKEAKAKADRKAALLEINKLAANYFYYQLKQPQGKIGYDYLVKRKLTDETIRRFGLGFSNKISDDLYRYLKSKGYEDELLKDTGLVTIEERGARDKFWNRVMFPIMDVNSRVIGFGGRVLGDGEPKYLNSPETMLFDKSRNLYGLNYARTSRKKYMMLCEGYMDVISMHQAGFTNAVASLGTALTSGHASLVKRYTKEVLLLYDSDGAGVEATKKVIAILREVGVGARVINMRPYKDPDEFIQNLGSEAFEERIKKAESGMMFLARIYSEEYDQSDPGELTKFQNQIARELAYIEDDLERNNYVDAIARKYVIDKDALAAKVHAYGVAGTAKPEIVERETRRLQEQQGYEEFPGDQSAGAPGRPETKDNKTAKLLLTWLVNRPELFARLDGVVSEADFEPGIYRTVADKLYSQYREKHKVEPAVVVNTFQDVEEQRLVAGMLQTDLAIDMTEEEIGNAITEVVKKIKLASIKKQLESENDMMKVQQLIKDRKKIEKFKVIL